MVELSDSQISVIKKSFPSKVGNRIRTIRLEKKISQTQLGIGTGKDRQYIYKIEKGIVTINIVTLKMICKSL